ncbi:MAG: hypothetical protein SGARI_001162 [Bacillariaceae sp.]
MSSSRFGPLYDPVTSVRFTHFDLVLVKGDIANFRSPPNFHQPVLVTDQTNSGSVVEKVRSAMQAMNDQNAPKFLQGMLEDSKIVVNEGNIFHLHFNDTKLPGLNLNHLIYARPPSYKGIQGIKSNKQRKLTQSGQDTMYRNIHRKALDSAVQHRNDIVVFPTLGSDASKEARGLNDLVVGAFNGISKWSTGDQNVGVVKAVVVFGKTEKETALWVQQLVRHEYKNAQSELRAVDAHIEMLNQQTQQAQANRNEIVAKVRRMELRANNSNHVIYRRANTEQTDAGPSLAGQIDWVNEAYDSIRRKVMAAYGWSSADDLKRDTKTQVMLTLLQEMERGGFLTKHPTNRIRPNLQGSDMFVEFIPSSTEEKKQVDGVLCNRIGRALGLQMD